jgi:predicted regulator of Ras-like GTPase activity (Roadblock/LC7/MglB family)
MQNDNWKADEDERWKIEEITKLQGVRHVVVTTSDGLVKAHSEKTGKEQAERLGAACAGLHSLGGSVSAEFGSGGMAVQQVLVGFDGGYLFVRRAGDGSKLAVLTDAVVDVALIGQQMTAQILKIGQRNYATPARAPLPGSPV